MYTHTFEIRSQMMDVLSFVLDTTEEWCGYSVSKWKQRNIATTIRLAYHCLFLVTNLVY